MLARPNHGRSGPMFRSTIRLIAAPALATFIVIVSCAASAQGFLDDLFGNSDRFSSGSQQDRGQPPVQSPPAGPGPQGRVAQGAAGELTMRIDRLEAQI